MQISGVPPLRIESKRHPFTRLKLWNIDIRRIKNPYAHIVAGRLRSVYCCNRDPGQNKNKTHLRFHMFFPTRIRSFPSKKRQGSRAGCREKSVECKVSSENHSLLRQSSRLPP